jgi:mannose-6-phosphate isomerase-like protein (cupin superfamily)
MTTRRDLCRLLPAVALLAPELTRAQEHAPTPAQAAASAAEAARGTKFFAQNQVIRASAYPIKTSKTGSSQAIGHGSLITGEGVEQHNTVLLPGMEPHPPHKHEHSEWLFIREGNVEWLVEGARQPAGPGDICYAASNQLHGLRNVGTVPAKYFVMAVGPNLKA